MEVESEKRKRRVDAKSLSDDSTIPQEHFFGGHEQPVLLDDNDFKQQRIDNDLSSLSVTGKIFVSR